MSAARSASVVVDTQDRTQVLVRLVEDGRIVYGLRFPALPSSKWGAAVGVWLSDGELAPVCTGRVAFFIPEEWQ